MYSLGLSAFYHDSAAALVRDGEIIAAAQEERFSRRKHDSDFPLNALAYCLETADLSLSEVDLVTFYDKPFLKFERLLETYVTFAPRGFQSFRKAVPVWLKEKLFQKDLLIKALKSVDPAFDPADRLLFGPAVSITTGKLTDSGAAVDYVKQLEGGVKYRNGGLTLNATAFHAKTEEQNFEATTQTFFNRNYRAYGLELEGGYRTGRFSITAGGTYTDAKIVSDVLNPAVVGNRPRRQAKFLYQVTPQYDAGIFSIGANVIGTSSSFTQDSNQLKLPGYTQVNAFLTAKPIDRITLSLNANNLFDVKGFTEAEDAAIPTNGIVRARSINGRTISASVRFDF